MKAFFINLNILGQELIPLGTAYILSYLKDKGHQVSLFDYTFNNSDKNCIAAIKKVDPDLICFSIDSGKYRYAVNLAKKLKKHSGALIVFGGPHPTVSPEETIKSPNVDIICIGEGEEALEELLEKMENNNEIYDTRNLWFKKGEEIIKNPVRPLIQDLDKLPFPDREIFDIERYLEITGSLQMSVGRGCPYRCTYCIHHIVQKIYGGKGKYVRQRSVERVISEIRQLVNKYQDIDTIEFYDDIFTISKEWILKFCKKYKEIGLPFCCDVRVETVDRDMLFAMKDAGCYKIAMGIETGNEKLRREVLNRNMTNQKIIEVVKIAKEAGLAVHVNNMIGIPYETKENYLETVKLNQTIKPDAIQSTMFQPYPGTALFKLCVEKGWVSKDVFLPKSYRSKSIINYPHVSHNTINWRRKLFKFRVFRKYNLTKAIILLLSDVGSNIFFKIRTKLPFSIKKKLFEMDLALKENKGRPK